MNMRGYSTEYGTEYRVQVSNTIRVHLYDTLLYVVQLIGMIISCTSTSRSQPVVSTIRSYLDDDDSSLSPKYQQREAKPVRRPL